MKPLIIRPLSFTLIAAWFAVSSAAAAEQYGGFSPDADGHQAYLDYINGLKTIKVEAGDELQQAIKAIPIESDIALTSEQEADLRGWLYDLLIAFSASGSDSLAAAFYLRGGVNNPEGIQAIKKQFEAFKSGPAAAQLKSMGIEIPEQPVDDTPFDLFKAMHRFSLDMKGCDYFFGNASFFDSSYRIFELQGGYESYVDFTKTHGLFPMRGHMEWSPKLRKEIEEGLKAGEQWTAAEFMFIAEEPEAFADFERGPMRYPFFVRLVWSPEQNMWSLVEAFVPNNAPVLLLFKSM